MRNIIKLTVIVLAVALLAGGVYMLYSRFGQEKPSGQLSVPSPTSTGAAAPAGQEEAELPKQQEEKTPEGKPLEVKPLDANVQEDTPLPVKEPENKPQETRPPATEPPVTEPPATEPPVTDPPATEPPATEPPATEPPVTEPPATDPPATEPPATEPPATEPPATEPPATAPPATEPPKPERQDPKAPNFTVYDAQGRAVNLSDYIGKPIVLNFWASWCGPCKHEMPAFQSKYLEHRGDVQFLMVNATQYDTPEDAKAFITQQGYSFPVFYDQNGGAAATYGIRSFPTTFFIDAEGYLIAQAIGAIDAATLQQGIDMIV